MPRAAAAAAMDVPSSAPARGGLQVPDSSSPARRHGSCPESPTRTVRISGGGGARHSARTVLLSASPGGGGLGGGAGTTMMPLSSPSFSGHGFIRQNASPLWAAAGGSESSFSPPPLDLRSSLPTTLATIISQSNLAAVANGTTAPDTREPSQLSNLTSPSTDGDLGSVRGSLQWTEQPWAPRSEISSPLHPDERHGSPIDAKLRINESIEAPLLPEPPMSIAEQQSQNDDEEGGGNHTLKCLIFGLINAIVAVPCMIAYAAIIFADPFFKDDMDQLVKLVLFSSLIHQGCFSTKSSLPFAIGQVQDAGLIFLSQMAKSIVDSCEMADVPHEETLATALVGLAVCTAALGAALWLTGRLQLADAVQYLPLPVIGGYLAFIGLYCFEAALSLMTGLEITGLLSLDEGSTQWHEVFKTRNIVSRLHKNKELCIKSIQKRGIVY